MKMNIERTQQIMGSLGIEGWLIATHPDKKDPFFEQIVSSKEVSAYLLVTQNKIHLLISSLDSDNIVSTPFDSFSTYSSGDKSMISQVNQLLQDEGIKKLALNYSTLGDTSIDTLGFGEGTSIMSGIQGENPQIIFTSAEEIVYGIVDIKTPKDIEKMTLAQKRADQILRDTFKKIEVGMTEREVAEITRNIFGEKPRYFDAEDIVGEEYSWNESDCPIVLTGENFTKGGHAETSDTIIEAGNTVYLDFGVKLTFKDGTKWSSDIQRVGYVLKQGENQAPSDIQEYFDTIVDSITAGIKGFKPGMSGEEADNIVRNIVTSRSGVDYDHSTGHPIGENAHGPGVMIGDKNPRKELRLNEYGVYTIEPRIPLNNGISVEEMVVVSDKGNFVIGERQLDIILING